MASKFKVMLDGVSTYSPFSLFEKCHDSKYAIMMLNNIGLLKWNASLTGLWNGAHLRIAVDGGLNHFHQINSKFPLLFPKIISGDFDSADKKIIEMYRDNKEILIIPTPDQNETDFTKAIRLVLNDAENNKIDYSSIVVLTCCGGRIDHSFAFFDSLFRFSRADPPIIFFGENESFGFVINKGKHNIFFKSGLDKHWCGLVPLFCHVESVTTQGLRWNMEKEAMGFGKLMSTSNQIQSDPLFIETTGPLLFLMGFEPSS